MGEPVIRRQLWAMVVWILLSAWILACNFLTSTVITQAGIVTPMATATTESSATPNPTLTPTQAPADQCPPYAFDSFSADFLFIQDPAEFRGKHYDPVEIRNIVDGYAGEMLDDVHALSDLFLGGRRVEFLERLICHAADGKAYFEITDALILNLTEDQTIARICWANGNSIAPILAIGAVDFDHPVQTISNQSGWVYRRLDSAYVVDVGEERIRQIPLEGLECIQPDYGG